MSNQFFSTTSYWSDTANMSRFKPLQRDLSVDVAIVGGGITGLTCAYLLKQSGLKVAVVEKHEIGSGTTAGTTGKVTSQHNLIYADLQERLGKATAKTYGQANQVAIQRIAEIIRTEKINCDWQIDDNYVYTTDKDKLKQYKREARVAKSLGLPASFVTETGLPFKVAGAVKFADQAKFNARAYTHGLARIVNGQGSHVLVNSQVTGFRDGDRVRIKANDAAITAKDIIVASKVPVWPLLARFSYGFLEYPQTSYIVAGDYAGDLQGMYISTDDQHYSILPTVHDGRRVLLIGGQNHIPGIRPPAPRLDALADYAKRHFDVEADYRWKAMDYLAYDNVPLIGKLYPWSKHIYVATGFMKWGLSTSMVAAMILHDAITNQPNAWAETFDSTRLRPVWSIPRTIFG